MTRKDYVLIAKALSDARQHTSKAENLNPSQVIDVVASVLTGYLAGDNERFDHQRFLKAAGAA